MDQSLELQWLIRLRDGDKAALEYFIDTRGALLVRFAFGKVQDRQEAEDIVQEMFIKLWNSRTSMDHPIDAWIYSITENACVDALRRRGARTRRHIESSRRLTVADAEEINYELLLEVLSRAEHLSPAVREVFRLRFDEDLEVKEIAELLHKDRQTVLNQISHAINTLRKQLIKIKLF